MKLGCAWRDMEPPTASRSTTRATASAIATTSPPGSAAETRRGGRAWTGAVDAAAGAAARRRRSADGSSTPRLARRQAEGVLSRSQSVDQRRGRRRRSGHHHRRQRARIASRYGTASWVYGEELGQRTAMWWSPDSRKLAYYRFDEKQVPDYHLQVDQTQIQSKDDVEAYPKAGAPNPIVELFVYDVACKKSTQGRRAQRQAVRQRRRRTLRLSRRVVGRTAPSCCSTAPTAGRTSWSSPPPTRTPARRASIIREEWPTGWVENSPAMTFLKDGTPLHLGVGAQRLEQPLSLRPERQADRAADDAHRIRGRRHCSRSTKRRA